MIEIPLLRWGQPYDSLEKDTVVHFETGEELARVSRANPGIVQRDLKKAERAREVLRAIPIRELIEIVGRAGELYMKADLPLGDGMQSPADFARMQSATTGLPEHLCAANMVKNYFVLTNLERILDSLTRGLPLEILAEGRGVESRGVPVSYQALTPVLGLVLPSNSPGVHTLWLPIIPLQIGLVFKPGPQEPWTPFRMTEAFFQAGIPREAISIYPGLGDIGAAVLEGCPKSLIFGGTATVERYKGNPAVQVHGPGFSKILLGDDVVDDWERYLDLMAMSVLANSGRGCINCSGIWASRHTEEIAQALAERFAQVRVLPANDPEAGLAAFTVPGAAKAISQQIDSLVGQGGASDVTAKVRAARGGDADGTGRLVERAALRLPAADRDPRAVTRGAARQRRVHVPVRVGGALPAGPHAASRSARPWWRARSPRTRSSPASSSTPPTSTGSTSGRSRPSSSTGCSPTRATSSSSCSGTGRSRRRRRRVSAA